MRPAAPHHVSTSQANQDGRQLPGSAAASITPDTPVQFVRGVGPRRAELFSALGVSTVGDLLEYFPFRHELRPRSRGIAYAAPDQTATIIGELRNVRTQGTPANRVVSASVVDGTGRAKVRWFNSAYLIDKLHHGQIVRLTGKAERSQFGVSFTNPQLHIVEEGDDPTANDRDTYEPIYAATAELPSREIARTVRTVLDAVTLFGAEFLPDALRTRLKLPPRRSAILQMHRPTSPGELEAARRRMAYEEFLVLQLAFQLSRRRYASGLKAAPIPCTARVDERIRKRLPFALTPAQDRAVAEIIADLARNEPMNRMLQADVGAGKTAVAVYAALTAIANRKQVALLAPTEVLAGQHFAKIDQYLAGSRVKTAHLTGSASRASRRSVLASLARGEIDFVIGTHALLEADVAFHELGLAIIDEQHKFGVAQRAALRAKGRNPHTLVLTATPIPRTLAMSLFGDLDVSIIDGAPPGRKPIETRLVSPREVDAAWTFVRSRLLAGQQAYIVYPLIDESDDLPLKAAAVEAERLSRTVLSGIPLGLLHGRMKTSEKGEVMERFRRAEVRALVATTVIEVGIDVPNATVMVIQHAERYGLSQLHQLRGRIGRGKERSFCLLFAETESAPTMERLRILCACDDGFRIAEEDLRMRGPGELLGTRQHGLPMLKVGDPLRDISLLEQARGDAGALLRTDAELRRREHDALRDEVMKRYGAAMALVDT
jgi:ATP-dependent DNA helicase RecG